MADVELVIKIPEEIYESCKREYEETDDLIIDTFTFAIANGTPSYTDVLDKIRAEIDAQIDIYDTPFEIDGGMDVSVCKGLNKAKEIIDKYNGEREEDEIL